jgi:uncharacterized sulfatase
LVTHRDDPAVAPFYKREFEPRPAEELYDLKKDPHQLVNVASDPAYASALQSLSGRLLGILRETGDPRVAGDGSTFDRPPCVDTRPSAGPSSV